MRFEAVPAAGRSVILATPRDPGAGAVAIGRTGRPAGDEGAPGCVVVPRGSASDGQMMYDPCAIAHPL